MNNPRFVSRIRVMVAFIVLWSAGIVYRLVDLQILQVDAMMEKSENLHYATEKIPARRGEILDSEGRLLAISREEYYIFADPARIESPKATAEALAEILNKDLEWEQKKTRELSNKKKRFLYVEKRVSENVIQKVKELKMQGVHYNTEMWRRYPNGWIASHILGFMNQSGSAKEGLEYLYDEEMKGKPGELEIMRDGRRKKNGLETTVVREPVIGANIQLTLDANIQLFVEDALRRAKKRTRARNLTAIVVNPSTGALLGMANIPDFNPNHFEKFTSFKRKNRAVVDVYEPASAFKIVTVAAALDSGTIKPNRFYDCEKGGIRVYDRYIKDHASFDTLSVEEILWHSSNVGSIKIGRAIPPKEFYNYITAFGFGEKTGLDLPAESSGILAPPEDWSKTTSAFLSIGHEISATPIQMLMAAAVVANKGRLVKPYIAQSIHYDDGTVKDLTPDVEPRQVIKEETAAVMVEMLKGVVTKGTAKAAQIPGVEVFGKTGTAQRIQSGKYSRDKFNASFVGFFPADAPRYGMIVVVHDPQGKVHGGEVAAPIFSEIGEHILQYEQAREPKKQLVVSMQTPNWPSPDPVADPNGSVMPDFYGMGLRNLARQSRSMGLKLQIVGAGRVVGQTPGPGAPIPETRVCKVQLKEG